MGSFDPSKGAILKNYDMFYSEIENNNLQLSNNRLFLFHFQMQSFLARWIRLK